MTEIGKENIKNWIKGSDMFDEHAREYAINLISKDIPKKVINRDHCPECNQYLGCEGFEQKHCDECGQKLEWV